MRARLAFLAVFLISACGLGYQLIAGTVSSYLLGDSVTQFSVTIGLYLSALGLGSYLTRFLERDLADRFVSIELAVAVAGGYSALALMFAYGSEGWFRPLLYGNILVVGTLVGVEIPLLMRLLKDELDLKELLAKVLAWDYIGRPGGGPGLPPGDAAAAGHRAHRPGPGVGQRPGGPVEHLDLPRVGAAPRPCCGCRPRWWWCSSRSASRARTP